MLIYAGIDEAGYGPMFGPLCVGLSCLEISNGSGDIPDVWETCAAGVCRSPRDAGTDRVAINDSKALKLPNNASRDPVTHLERGVLAMLGASDAPRPACDGTLMEAFGVRTTNLPWYTGDPIELPIATTADHIRLLGSRTQTVFGKAGVRVGPLRCACADERAFNRLLGESNSKAGASFRVVARLVRDLLEHYDAHDDAVIKLVIDRQGARRSYAGVLREAIGPCDLRVIEQSDRASVYEIRRERGPVVRIMFRSKADAEHFPVALASMAAKLVRELMMRRFNRYWCGRIAELKPTAGYVTDARRWLRDAGPHLSPDERDLLVRKA